MNWKDYIYPVRIEYNREYMLEMVKRIEAWPIYSNDRGKSFFSTHKDIYFPVNAEAIRIKNSLIKSTTFSFSWVPVGHETGWHSDSNRGATLILPLDDEPHLIEFEIDGEVIPYHYSEPVLTNANTWHNGRNHSQVDRYNLLFHFDTNYVELVNSIDKNEFVTEWKQDYNVCVDADLPMVHTFFNAHNEMNLADILITSDLETANSFNGFVIVLNAEKYNQFTNIRYADDVFESDILNAIKFVLDNPTTIKNIELTP